MSPVTEPPTLQLHLAIKSGIANSFQDFCKTFASFRFFFFFFFPGDFFLEVFFENRKVVDFDCSSPAEVLIAVSLN